MIAPFDPFKMTLTFLLGLCLGAFFFGGLWWTVRRGVASPRPAAWFLPSFLGRIGVITFGFYFISGEGVYAMGACFIGFLGARIGVTWLTRPQVMAVEVSHPN